MFITFLGSASLGSYRTCWPSPMKAYVTNLPETVNEENLYQGTLAIAAYLQKKLHLQVGDTCLHVIVLGITDLYIFFPRPPARLREAQ